MEREGRRELAHESFNQDVFVFSQLCVDIHLFLDSMYNVAQALHGPLELSPQLLRQRNIRLPHLPSLREEVMINKYPYSY